MDFFQEPVELSEPTIFQEGNYKFQKFEAWLNIIFTVYETHPAGAEISGFDCNFSIVFATKIMHLEQSNPFLIRLLQKLLVELSEPLSPKVHSPS